MAWSPGEEDAKLARSNGHKLQQMPGTMQVLGFCCDPQGFGSIYLRLLSPNLESWTFLDVRLRIICRSGSVRFIQRLSIDGGSSCQSRPVGFAIEFGVRVLMGFSLPELNSESQFGVIAKPLN